MMALLSLLLWALGWYLLAGLSVYAYAVIKNKEYSGYWWYKMDEERIGICVYPKWLLFWLYFLIACRKK